jgi:hypothetical protein
MFNKWLQFGALLVILIVAGIAFVKVRDVERLKLALKQQHKIVEVLQTDASRDKKAWEEVYRSCVAENSILREKLEECDKPD